MSSTISSTNGQQSTASQVAQATQAVAGSGTGASSLVRGGNQGMGKDEFMKLLVAQVSHQDPLKPMDDTAFVAQLAQFSSLEQMLGINTRLDALSSQERGVGNTQMGGLIGKNVTLRGDVVHLDGSGVGGTIGFSQPISSTSTQVNITDAKGKSVRTIAAGAFPAGASKVTWDGKDDTGTPQPAGQYTISVKAVDGTNAINVTQNVSGSVEGVTFGSGGTQVVLDNGASGSASDLLSIDQPPVVASPTGK